MRLKIVIMKVVIEIWKERKITEVIMMLGKKIS